MVNFRFEKWCRKATASIVFVPDRIEVQQELYQHMLDRYEAEIRHGLTHEEAERRTIAAMGDPDKIAPQLGAIHRPFWGRFHLLSKRILSAMVCIALCLLCTYLLKSLVLNRHFSSPVYYRYNPYKDFSVTDSMGHAQQLTSGKPDVIAYSDGYLFCLRRYALWKDARADHSDETSITNQMYLQMQVISLVPWACHTDISRWFAGRDNLGNEYHAAYERVNDNTPSLQTSWYHTAPCIYTHDIRFTDFISTDAAWLELYYDRAGRDITLRIDLTGEESP